jgi:methylated-DNA-[protein]-cysteine S-methyltransferase
MRSTLPFPCVCGDRDGEVFLQSPDGQRLGAVCEMTSRTAQMLPDSTVLMVRSPWGWLCVRHAQGVLLHVDLQCPAAMTAGDEAPGAAGLRDEFARYFRDGQHDFQVVLRWVGTRFQQKVWQALRDIPAGETRRYGELAEVLGSSAQAVGNACRANPCPIVVPCHRVVARNGLGGFAGVRGGPPLMIKRWLLRHEGVQVD